MLKTLLGALAIAAAMLAAPAQAQTMFRPIAVVNDSAITGFDLTQRAQILATLGFPAANQDALRAEALDRLIEDRLKMQEGARLGITAEDDKISEALDRIAKRANVSLEELLKGMKARGVSEQALRDMVSADVIWQQVVRGRFNRRIDPGEAEIDAEIGEMMARGNASYKVAEIGLPLRDSGRTEAQTRELADKLYEQLSQGGDFDAAVKRYSRAPSASRGGLVGWVESVRLPPDIADTLAGLQPGEIARPIEVSGGISVLKLLEIKTDGADGLNPSDPALREEVTKRLQNERAQRLAEGLLQELRRDALIEMR